MRMYVYTLQEIMYSMYLQGRIRIWGQLPQEIFENLSVNVLNL